MIVWYCNPFLHEACEKTGCYLHGGPCHLTSNQEAALTDKNGTPLRGPDVGMREDKAHE